MRNKVALALLVLAASIVMGACGGTQEGEALGSRSTPTTPRALRNGRLPHTDPSKGCDAQGVNSTQLLPGACTENGIRYVVAGPIEQTTYGDAGLAKWDQLGRRVYSSGGTTVWELN